MAITTAMCNSFKQKLLGGVHDLDTDSLKLALIKATPTGTYNASTTNYSNVTGNSDEASGTNYTAGGQVLDGATTSPPSSENPSPATGVVCIAPSIKPVPLCPSPCTTGSP